VFVDLGPSYRRVRDSFLNLFVQRERFVDCAVGAARPTGDANMLM